MKKIFKPNENTIVVPLNFQLNIDDDCVKLLHFWNISFEVFENIFAFRILSEMCYKMGLSDIGSIE